MSADTCGFVAGTSTRGSWNIFLSCISTLILCAWTSLHPSIQTSDFFLKKVIFALETIFVPEMMLACAIARFISVRRDVKACNAFLRKRRSPPCVTGPGPDPHPGYHGWIGGFSQASLYIWRRLKGAILRQRDLLLRYPWNPRFEREEEHSLPPQRERWTLFEGFYADMGGFCVVSADGKSEKIMSLEGITELEIEHRITPVPLAEIQDKSKGDWVSNLIALIQTIWFVLQCCARVAQHLPLSILELGTLGYVAATIAIHVFWMHKPKDIRTPTRVQIHSQDPSEDSRNDTSQRIGLAEQNKDETERDALLLDPEGRPPLPSQDPLLASTGGTAGAISIDSGRHPARPHANAEPPMYQRPPIYKATRPPTSTDTLFDGDKEKGEASEHVMNPDDIGLTIYTIVCTLFGLWHCIAWNSYFPTDVERLLWRIASVLSALPAVSFLVSMLQIAASPTEFKRYEFVLFTGIATGMIGTSFYIFARGFLLVEMFLSLRRMPNGVFQTVQWTNFIPHI